GTTRARARKDNVKGDIYDTIDYGLSSMLLHAAAMCQSQPKFIYLSCTGIGTSEPRNSYLRARYKIERELKKSGLSWVSARPSFITGNREESRPLESLGARFMNSAVSVASAFGAKKWASTYRSQTGLELARALVAAALSDDYNNRVIESDELQRLHRLDD
ncbi:MAG: epimerase, partial [Myxococcota bacterium]|nr:epimerase [Myxococcota bacterium]